MYLPAARLDRRAVAGIGAALLVGGGVAALAATGRLDAEIDEWMWRFRGAAPRVLLLALAAPVLIWIADRPQRGVLLLAALVPFDGLLIVVDTPPFAEGWKEALFLYTLGWTLLSVVGKPRPLQRLPKFTQPLLLYVAVGVASAAAVRGAQGLVGLKIGYLFMGLLVVVWLQPLDARDRDRLVSILMAVAVVTALVGLWQQAVGAERLVSMGYEYNTHIRFTHGFLRSISTFNQPFPFAFFLSLVLLVGVPVSLTEWPRPRSVAFLAASPLLLVALAFTFVRGAWLALGVGLFYLALHRYKVLLLGVPIALLSLAFLPGTFSAPAFQGESFNDRQIGWVQNLDKVVSEPLGNGIGSTGSAAEKTREVLQVNEFFYQPDNQYFKVLYELGVVGLWFFLLALVATLVYVRSVERGLVGSERAITEGVTANVLGTLAACTVATYFEIFPMDLLFWLLVGVVVSCARESS